MFDSGMTLNDIISEIKSEVDVAPEIPDKTYLNWANSLEQLIYSEIIKEQGKISLDSEGFLRLDRGVYEIVFPQNTLQTEEAVRIEDITSVFVLWANGAKKRELTRVSPVMEDVYPVFLNSGKSMIYYSLQTDEGEKICVRTGAIEAEEFNIYYNATPKLKTIDDEGKITGNVMLPSEFIEIMKSKLRAEGYKLMNEDSVAAKWMNDYNTLIENFKVWLAARSPVIGR